LRRLFRSGRFKKSGSVFVWRILGKKQIIWSRYIGVCVRPAKEYKRIRLGSCQLFHDASRIECKGMARSERDGLKMRQRARVSQSLKSCDGSPGNGCILVIKSIYHKIETGVRVLTQ
jgi:hypothetical protein